MKKQITIVFYLLLNGLFLCSQQFVKTTTPCNDEQLKKTPGRWIKGGNGFHAKVSQQQQKEIQNRLDAIHPLIFNIYPSPVAFDAAWFGFTADQEFGSQLKFDHSPNVGRRGFEVNGTPTIYYTYSAKFCAYHCGREANEIMRGAGCETGTTVGVEMNTLGPLLLQGNLDDDNAEIMRIDGRPIKRMAVLREKKWKGYDLYSPQTGSGVKMVLLHREGVLPYIPVTRKEYLDRCLEGLPKFFDYFLKPPDTTTIKLMGKNEWDEQMKKFQKLKEDVLKYYKDELTATTSKALLDSPAVIFGNIMEISTSIPIFVTQASGGTMLVTANPAYFKKGLPKYIPQLMIYSWWDCQCGPDQSLNPYKLYDENFPIEKLQAMIDK